MLITESVPLQDSASNDFSPITTLSVALKSCLADWTNIDRRLDLSVCIRCICVVAEVLRSTDYGVQ